MSKTRLDMSALFDALDAKRYAWGTNWAAICDSAGIARSTITRWKAGSSVSAENLAALMAWFGETDFGPYLIDAPTVTPPALTEEQQ